MVELCKNRHKGLVFCAFFPAAFPAGHCLKNPEDKAKAGGMTPLVILPNHLKVFRVLSRDFSFAAVLSRIFFFLILGRNAPCICINSDPRLSNQGEELHAGTGSLSEAVSLQEW